MHQLIRYGLIGIISNITVYCLYLLTTYLGFPSKIAMTFMYVLGASIGFFGNKRLTFNYTGKTVDASMRYVLAQLAGYLLNLAALYIFVDQLGYAHQWVQAAAIVVVAGFLFWAHKYFVFRSNTNH